MSKFGWSLPPGVTNAMIEEAAGAYAICETCGQHADSCDCPECPVCHEVGNPYCYEQGHLKYTKAQLIGQAKHRIADLESQLDDERTALEMMEDEDVQDPLR